MERGNSKHSPREDDMLAAELNGTLGPGGSNREEWVDPEPPADDDVVLTDGAPAAAAPTPAAKVSVTPRLPARARAWEPWVLRSPAEA